MSDTNNKSDDFGKPGTDFEKLSVEAEESRMDKLSETLKDCPRATVEQMAATSIQFGKCPAATAVSEELIRLAREEWDSVQLVARTSSAAGKFDMSAVHSADDQTRMEISDKLREAVGGLYNFMKEKQGHAWVSLRFIAWRGASSRHGYECQFGYAK